MRSKIFFAVFAFLALISGYSHAGTWTVWSNVRETYVHTQYGGYGFFGVTDNSVNPNNCSATTWYSVSKQDNPNFNEIYSLMVAAHVSGKKVRFWVEGCSPHNYPLIHHAQMSN